MRYEPLSPVQGHQKKSCKGVIDEKLDTLTSRQPKEHGNKII